MNLHSLYKTWTKKIVDLFPEFEKRIVEAIDLIDSVPGYGLVASRLRRRTIKYVPSLPDRAQTTLRFQIIVGPASFLDGETAEYGVVGLAGTLVHEEFHTRQNPLRKTASFWLGVFTRSHPMARYEWPAYRAQTAFLRSLALARPEYADAVNREVQSIAYSVAEHYGDPPFDL